MNMSWTEAEELISEMHELIKDITSMSCVQTADGWTEDVCAECRFAVNDGCDIWNRREDLLQRSDPDPLPF